jgi:flagellar basal body-associated protein FliL
MSPKNAAPETEATGNTEEVKPNQTKWGMIIGLIVVQVILAFLLVYFFILPRLAPQDPEAAKEKDKVEKKEKKEVGVIYTISDITINPRDSYGRRFAVFEIGLEIPDDQAKEELDRMRPLVLDHILQYLRSQTVADLTVKLDIEKMKEDIKDTVNEVVGQDLVENVYFTKFVLE